MPDTIINNYFTKIAIIILQLVNRIPLRSRFNNFQHMEDNDSSFSLPFAVLAPASFRKASSSGRNGSNIQKFSIFNSSYHHGLQTVFDDSMDSPEELATLTGLCGGV